MLKLRNPPYSLYLLFWTANHPDITKRPALIVNYTTH
jgi:hypothetical protein